MDKCIICERVFDAEPPFYIQLDDDPNCEFCSRRWCTDCADANDLYTIILNKETLENMLKCFLCVMGERKGRCRIRYR